MNWYHARRGQYSIKHRSIAIDWAGLFLHPHHAEATAVHELTHAIIADFDFGQLTSNFFSWAPQMTHLSEVQRNEMFGVLIDAQDYVQEGMATFMQIQTLAKSVGKANALRWAASNMPKEYVDRLHTFAFVFGMSQRYRDFFTDKAMRLAMQCGARKSASVNDIYRSPEKLKEFLAIADNNPNERLRRVVEVVRLKPGLLTRSLVDIAEAAEISFYDAPTKIEVAEFLNYGAPLSGIDKKFVESDIGETPNDISGYQHLLEDAVLGNLNFNFTGNAQMIKDQEELDYYSDVIEAVLIMPATADVKKIFERGNRPSPDIVFAMFRRTGEKYTMALPKSDATIAINGALAGATLFIKTGGFNTASNLMIPSENMRPADVVIQANIKTLEADIGKLLEVNPDASFKVFHAGASPNHVFQTLMLRVGGQHPIHIVNTVGNTEISRLLEKISDKAFPLDADELRAQEKSINNAMSIWMGLPWEINWVKSMIEKDALYHRPQK